MVPIGSRSKLIDSYHRVDSIHEGLDKTYDIIFRSYFWPRMKLDIEKIVSTCEQCQRHKPICRIHRAKLSPMEPETKFHTWQTAIAGPLPRARNGERYIIIFVDQFSKRVEAFETSNIDSNTLIKCTEILISRFGYPERIYSDQGSQYESSEYKDFCNSHKILKTRSSPYHPEGNGLAERNI